MHLFLVPLLLPLASPGPVTPSPLLHACSDFTATACDLSDNNIVSHTSNTDSPQQCQVGQLASKEQVSAKLLGTFNKFDIFVTLGDLDIINDINDVGDLKGFVTCKTTEI